MPDDNDADDPIVNLKRSEIRNLEKKAGKFDEATTRAEAAERKLAFAEAGIPLNDPKAGYFMRGYDGDLTSDAIKAAALEAGFIEDPDKANDAANADDAAALQRMQEAEASGGLAPTGTDEAMNHLLSINDEEQFFAEARAAGLAT